ncbi:MAG: cytochrome ubiquinol oxidase subunit I, partial [Burkholderiales bacterium]
NGKAHPVSWLQIIFNPWFPYRISHMMTACALSGAFLVAGISAYRWLRGDKAPSVLAALKTAVYVAALFIPLQIFLGDIHGLNTLKHQPAKIAAIEAVWETERGAPLLLFAIPDQTQGKNHFEIAIPKMASFILTHELDGEIQGLNEFKDKHPPVAPVFWAFRIMVGVGMLMLVVSWFAAWQLQRGNDISSLATRALVLMTFSGWVATLAGWYVTEIGRQPYLVYGLLTTAQAASAVPASMIAATLAMYLVLYVGLAIAYVSVVFHLARKAGYNDSEKTVANIKLNPHLSEGSLP